MEGTPVRARLTALVVSVLPAAMIVATLDVAGTLLTVPVARGVSAPLLWLATTAIVALFALPFTLPLAVVEPVLRRVRRPSPEVLLAGALAALLASGASRGLHLYFERMTTEFPAVVDRVKDVGALALAGGALFLAWLALPLLARLAQRFERLTSEAVLVVLGAFTAGLFGVYLPRTLSSIHGHPWSTVCVISSLPLWLLVVHSRVRAASPRAALSSGAALFVVLVAGLASLQHPATAFLFHASAPVAEELEPLVRPLTDADGDGALAPWFGGDDCASMDARVGPEAREVAGDGVDNDCRGGDASAAAVERPAPSGPWAECLVSPPGPGWSVLLVTLDAVRAAALRPEVAPNIARLAQRSAWFTRAYAPATNTVPSMSSLFTGLAASEVVLRSGVEEMLLLDVSDTLPRRFRAAGRRTGMAFTFSAPKIVTEGFDVVGPAHADHRVDAKEGFSSADVTRAALDFVEETPADKPFFFWAHYPDAHAPYLDPVPGRGALPPEQRYLAELAYIDHHLGRLLASLAEGPRASSTVVVLTSDHGEDLRERGKEGHGPDVYERSIHVPLALHVPGCPSTLVEQPVSGVDLFATLSTLISAPASGPTLFDAVAGHPRGTPVVAEARFKDALRRAVVGQRHKLLVDVGAGGALLFDLQTDPEETTSVYEGPATEAMESAYQRWLDRPGPPGRP